MKPAVTPPNRAGLSDHEAARRLRRDGYNELPQSSRRTVLRIMLEVAHEPMFQLLCAAGIVYLVLGDIGEALMLLAFVAITIPGSASDVDVDIIKYLIIKKLLIFISTSRTLPWRPVALG
jgi:magnesium-transporting ATPase (P-type)